MKICTNCSRVNPDDTEECLECGESKFEDLLEPAPYNNAEMYEKELKREQQLFSEDV